MGQYVPICDIMVCNKRKTDVTVGYPSLTPNRPKLLQVNNLTRETGPTDKPDQDLLCQQTMQQQSSGAPGLAVVRPSENPADRRAHPRIPSARLPFNRVHIPQRATVSLVDL